MCPVGSNRDRRGHLYTRIANFVWQREGIGGVGTIGQSLCHYLKSQLTEYYHLIVVLESQTQIGKGKEEPEATEENPGLTLKRLEV